MRILYAENDEAITEITDLAAVKSKLEDAETMIWVDLFLDTAEDSRRILTEIFDFHPLSVDDALVEAFLVARGHVPDVFPHLMRFEPFACIE